MTGAWRRAAYLLAAVTICSSAVVLAHSDEPGAAPGKESPQALLLKQADAKLDKVGCPTACRMTLRLDQARILQLVPTLQARGLVSHSITPAEVSGHPFYFANAIALLLASDAVRETYEADDGVNTSRWQVMLSHVTDSGAEAANEMFSFDFDRALYRQTDWDRLVFVHFPQLSQRFSYNLWLTARTAREMSGSIDDD